MTAKICKTCGRNVGDFGGTLCSACWEVENRLAGYLTRGGDNARAFVAEALGNARFIYKVRKRQDEKRERLLGEMSGFKIFKLDEGPLWGIRAPYFSPKLNSAAKTVPGVAWAPEHKAHVGYVDGIDLVVAKLRELGLKCEDVPAKKRSWAHNLPVSYEGARDYQREGIDFLVSQAGSGALLADDCGVGKSFQAAKAIRALRRKTIIVCPAHVRGVWERSANKALGELGGELAKWWPKANVFKPYGVTPEPIPSDTNVVVIHYDIVYAWVDVLLKWAKSGLTVVYDEAHALLNSASRRSQACAALAAKARGRIALTGTPPTDLVADMYGVVNTISPCRFGPLFYGYGMRYCGPEEIEVPGPENTKKTVRTFKGRSNIAELRQRLDWFVLRRTKREVLKELPALQRQVLDIEVPAKNRILMNAQLVGDKRRMRMALDSAADGKLKSVLEIIRGLIADGQRVVVGTYRRAVCEKIADEIGSIAPTAFIHGGVPITRRQKIIDDLKRNDGPICLVANIDATSTGIDLTFAGVGVVAELVWEPRDLVQWEARLHRFGASTTEPVIIKYVIARGTGDELILQAVINKLDNFLDLVETDKGDGMKEALVGEKDESLSRLAAALKKMGEKEVRKK